MKYHVSFDIDFLKNPYTGKFIVIEGVDGSGKSTQVELVGKQLEEKGLKVHITKEPTDTPTGKLLREALSGKLKLPPVALQYLFNADRAVHQLEIEEYLKKGYVVITDRYFWSSVAYGISDIAGVKQADWCLTVFSILSFYNQFLKPDFSFYLKIDPKIAAKRLEKSQKKLEIYDHLSKLLKIEKGYNYLLQKFPKEFIIIDGEKTEKEITEEIVEKII